MQMLEFIEELAKKICEIELCVSNLRVRFPNLRWINRSRSSSFPTLPCSNCWKLVTFDRDFDRFKGLDCLRLNAASH